MSYLFLNPAVIQLLLIISVVLVLIWMLLTPGPSRGTLTKSCSECRTRHPSSASFCRRCGRKLA
jgi:hypothetical protein